MIESIKHFFTQNKDMLYIPHIGLSDILEIIIMCLIIYYISQKIKKTRAFILIKGFFALVIIYLLSVICGFQAISLLFKTLFTAFMFVAIVILQPELRTFFENLGTANLQKNNKDKLLSMLKLNKETEEELRYSDETITHLSEACYKLGATNTGALIVIERDIPLNEFVITGIELKSKVSEALFINIFEHNTPLHDGAVIMQGDEITSATCYLPLSNNKEINKEFGTRHRAAIGLSEVSDAITIIVSEETGKVSICIDGKLHKKIPKEEFIKILKKYQLKGTIKKQKTLKEKLKHNSKAKLFSLLIAFFGWIFLINLYNPITVKEFKDIPITVINQDVLEIAGQSYRITSAKTANIAVKDRRSNIEKLKYEDIIIEADLQKLSYVNSVPLSIKIDKLPNNESYFTKNNTLTVELESIINKEFNIIVKKEGTEKKGFFINNIQPENNVINISGPKSVIETIDSVKLIVDVTNADDTYNNPGKIKVLDGNNKDITSEVTPSFTESNVNFELLYTKDVALNLNLNIMGHMDYEVKNTTYSPTHITIAADKEKIDSIDDINISTDIYLENVNIESNEYIKELDLSSLLSNSLIITKGNRININVELEHFDAKDITINPLTDITFSNLKANHKLTINPDPITINILGSEKNINEVSIKTLNPSVDLTNLEAGEYNMIINMNTNNIKIKDTYNVRFVIEKSNN